MSQETGEAQAGQEKVTAEEPGAQRSLTRAERKPSKRSKNAPAKGGAPAEAPAPATPTATEARNAELIECPQLSAVEREVLRMVNVSRADPHEVAEVLNKAQQTDGYTVERVAAILERARGKLAKAGEFEAARPSAYAVQDTRLRYDALIKSMRGELDALGNDPASTLLRVKLLKTIADVEAMRDAALQAIAPLPGSLPPGGALVYVSRLRGSPIAS